MTNCINCIYTLLQGTEINHLTAEVKRLKDELEKLEAVSGERDEKQKIIDELRKMVMDADVSKKSRLRSGYMALHYDSSSSEIKQLKTELKAMKTENETLKTENVMLKKSENLKKLSKLKDLKDEVSQKKDVESNEDKHQQQLSTKSNTKQQFIGTMQTQVPVRVTNRNVERQMFQFQGAQRSFMRASADDVHLNADDENKGKQQVKTKFNDKDKFNAELEFKFSNIENESLGQKRSSSKDRAGKRVTFVNDLSSNSNTDKGQKLSASVTIAESFGNQTFTSVATSVPHFSNGNMKTSPIKVERPIVAASRKKTSHLRTKSAARRSASLNSLSTSKDIMKMSSQLIQKSRSLRQNVYH